MVLLVIDAQIWLTNIFKRTFLKKAEGHILQKGEITGEFATE